MTFIGKEIYAIAMFNTLIKEWKVTLAIFLFLSFSLWWLTLQFPQTRTNFSNSLFGESYGVVALYGAIWGSIISVRWGGVKSILGRSIFMFSIGLYLQEFGQLSYFYYYFIKHVSVPYPSIGDIGYFGSIPFYIYGVVLLGQVSGAKFTLKSLKAKTLSVSIPICMLIFSYYIFLQGYKFDWSQPIKTFLDFGYPLGEAIYISGAILAYLLSVKILGGVMKYRILIILVALFIQYLCDFSFLYQANNNTFSPGGINDYMYLISYFVMTIGLLQLDGQMIKKSLER